MQKWISETKQSSATSIKIRLEKQVYSFLKVYFVEIKNKLFRAIIVEQFCVVTLLLRPLRQKNLFLQVGFLAGMICKDMLTLLGVNLLWRRKHLKHHPEFNPFSSGRLSWIPVADHALL